MFYSFTEVLILSIDNNWNVTKHMLVYVEGDVVVYAFSGIFINRDFK